MPTATLSYQLPEERAEYEMAVSGAAYRDALEAVAAELRTRDKYAEDQATTWAEVRQLFWDTITAAGVEL